MPEVALGFGGNLGDPAASIAEALTRLDAAGVAILRASHFYRTAPWGPVAQPDFVNSCALARTDLPARALLSLTQRIETELGRERLVRYGPRTLDIDILAYGDEAIDEPGLTLPHPRLTERAFVLVPLAEVAPGWRVAGRRVREWLARVDANGVRRIDAAA